jgi:hypothetical protein
METGVIAAALNVIHQGKERFKESAVLATIMTEYNIGRRHGVLIVFKADDKVRLVELLKQSGVPDPLSVVPGSWKGLTRAESLGLGSNEKMTSSAVRRDRIAVKTLPGKTLYLANGSEFKIGHRMHVELDRVVTSGAAIGHHHDSILLVENWESFNDLHVTNLNFSNIGNNPLVVWRGERSGCRVDHALAFIRESTLPVWAFVDYDPAGLGIALGLPRLAGVLAPPDLELASLLCSGLSTRFLDQLPQWQVSLERAEHPDIRRLWRIIQDAGKALPQEILIRSS